MPELPEVQTVVNGLNKKIKGKIILDILYCDNKKMFRGITFERFKKEIKNRKILGIKRRGKYIIVSLSGDGFLIFHLKMTGHILIKKTKKQKNKKTIIKEGRWVGENLPEELKDPRNQFIHLVLGLSGGLIFAFSDMRKFGVARLEKSDYLSFLDKELGLDVIDPKFDLNQFKSILDSSKGKIKAVLMNQNKMAGIGNIYGDEILFLAGVRPDRLVKSLSLQELAKIFKSIRPVLEKAIKYNGSSESDFRDTSGRKGDYQNHSLVYRKEKNACQKCGGAIKKIRIGQRSAHYCTKCQH